MRPDPIIEARDAARRIAAGAVAIDCRARLGDPGYGARVYADGHLPGAVRADLEHDLSDPAITGLGRHPLPEPPRFAAWLSLIGLTPDTEIVAYDDAQGAYAARLWWMLGAYGHHGAVFVLDGGVQAWKDAGLPLETTVPLRRPARYAARFDRARVVDVAALEAGLATRSLRLVDARAAPRFRGDEEPIDRVGGHVPGAVNRPFAANLDANGRFREATALRAEFEALLDGDSPERAVVMCGSGVTACHHLLAMERAGLAGARLYAPSWSGWIEDPKRPVAKGEA